ncbi:MAG: hypothetical protein LBE13_22335 [Bacteroidales bacterium]|jgi:hypothetical protein|nr:hypothetical protein [Bacteroidales bacterium]
MDCKIPFYNLLNMLFVGVAFGACFIVIDPYNVSVIWATIQDVLNNKVAEAFALLAIAYLIGLIINRIASTIVENALNTEKPKKLRNWASQLFQIEWRDYKSYQIAEKLDPHIKILSREYALSRNIMTMFLLLVVLSLLNCDLFGTILSVFLSFIFYFSARKHVKKIVSRIDLNTKKKTNSTDY